MTVYLFVVGKTFFLRKFQARTVFSGCLDQFTNFTPLVSIVLVIVRFTTWILGALQSTFSQEPDHVSSDNFVCCNVV